MVITPIQNHFEMHLFALHSLENSYPILGEELFLFHRIEHLQTQPCEKQWLFSLYASNKRRYVAHFPIFQKDNTLFSPVQAPFGGVVFEADLQAEVLFFFSKCCRNVLQASLEGRANVYQAISPMLCSHAK